MISLTFSSVSLSLSFSHHQLVETTFSAAVAHVFPESLRSHMGPYVGAFALLLNAAVQEVASGNIVLGGETSDGTPRTYTLAEGVDVELDHASKLILTGKMKAAASRRKSQARDQLHALALAETARRTAREVERRSRAAAAQGQGAAAAAAAAAATRARYSQGGQQRLPLANTTSAGNRPLGSSAVKGKE